jgi:hypothetical protein
VTNTFTDVSEIHIVLTEELWAGRETAEMLDIPMPLPSKVKTIDPDDAKLTDFITLHTPAAEDIASVKLPCLKPTEYTILWVLPKIPEDKDIIEVSDIHIPDSWLLWPNNARPEKLLRPVIDPNIVNASAPVAAELRDAKELATDSACENMAVILPRFSPQVKASITLLCIPADDFDFADVSEYQSVLSALLCRTLADEEINWENPKWVPWIVNCTEPDEGRFSRFILLKDNMQYEYADDVLLTYVSTEKIIFRECAVPFGALVKTLVSDTHSENSQRVKCNRTFGETSAALAIFAPCTVREEVKKVAEFLCRAELTVGISDEARLDKDEDFCPIVNIKPLLDFPALDDKQVTAESANHTVTSQEECLATADTECVFNPIPDPCTVTLIDPVDTPFDLT